MDVLFILTSVLVTVYWAGTVHLAGLLLAILMTSGNAIAAVMLVKRYLNADMNKFMAGTMGGMMLRLGTMLVIIILIFAFTNIPQISFIIGLFISYICKSVLEIICINKIRNQSQLLGK